MPALRFTGTRDDALSWLIRQDASKSFDVRERTKGRTLTQNAYYWVLLNRLASVLGMPDSEVHLHMLKEWGVSEVFSVREDVPVDGYLRYWEQIGEGTVDGRVFKHIRVYKGSSEMDSREFSRLLEGMREECLAQGIEVMTPEEMASLRFLGETWTESM